MKKVVKRISFLFLTISVILFFTSCPDLRGGPDAPKTAPVVTSGNAQLIVDWESDSTALSYLVLWAESDDISTAEKFEEDDKTDTNCVITGLTNGKTYYVWYKVVNRDGVSEHSPSAEGTPIDPTQQEVDDAVDKLSAEDIIFADGDSAISVKENIVKLPATGENETNISWESGDEALILVNDDGTATVTRPEFNPENKVRDKVVILTATVKKNDKTNTKEIPVTVKVKDPTDAEAVEYIENFIEDYISYSGNDTKDSVTGNITFLEAPYDTNISWASNDDIVEDGENNDGAIVINGATGEVTRPDATKNDKVITLTATISRGEVSSEEIPIDLTVKKQVTDQQAVDLVKSNIKTYIQYADGENENSVKNNITFVLISEYEANIVWSSNESNIAISGKTGTVTRPDFSSTEDNNTQVILTATISRGEVTDDTATITVTVIEAEPSDEQAVDAALLDVKLTYGTDHSDTCTINNVESDVTLSPASESTSYGAVTTWTSSDENLVTINEVGDTGVFKGSPVYMTVTLTATVSRGDVSKTKVFTLDLSPTVDVLHSDDVNNFGDSFGKAVDISADGTLAIVGAPESAGWSKSITTDLQCYGVAYFFKYDSTTKKWGNKIKFPIEVNPPDPYAFGYSVAIAKRSNGTFVAVIGDPYYKESGSTNNDGIAYIYESTNDGETWAKKYTTKYYSGKECYTGLSVDISDDGNTVVVGGTGVVKTDLSWAKGFLYITYNESRTEWEEYPQAYDTVILPLKVGNDVAINGNGEIIVVGAKYDDTNKGAAYIFEKEDSMHWKKSARIVALQRAEHDYFGNTVAINAAGDVVAIGALSKEVDGINQCDDDGAVYVYRDDGASWGSEEMITATSYSGTGIYNFSSSLAMNPQGTAIIAGTTKHPDDGAAYFYTYDGSKWDMKYEFLCNDGYVEYEEFGWSAAISENGTAIIGDSGIMYGERRGAALIYQNMLP